MTKSDRRRRRVPDRISALKALIFVPQKRANDRPSGKNGKTTRDLHLPSDIECAIIPLTLSKTCIENSSEAIKV